MYINISRRQNKCRRTYCRRQYLVFQRIFCWSVCIEWMNELGLTAPRHLIGHKAPVCLYRQTNKGNPPCMTFGWQVLKLLTLYSIYVLINYVCKPCIPRSDNSFRNCLIWVYTVGSVWLWCYSSVIDKNCHILYLNA